MNIPVAIAALARWEGSRAWMYRDTLGYCTTGIGHLIHAPDDAVALPWHTVGPIMVDATPEQVTAAFHAVMAAPEGRLASFYAPLTEVRLRDEDIERIAAERLEREFLPALRATFTGFDAYPDQAQRALVDIAWNVGARGIEAFQRLRAACAAGDWPAAALACRVASSRTERNAWRREMLLGAGSPGVA